MGGIAAKAAGRRVLGRQSNRTTDAAALKTVLGALKGPLMKVGQILSTVPDLLPPEYTAELAHLQTNAPSMGWAFVRRRMAAELGPDWRARFKSFEEEAAAAASLGQVHRAVAPDGRRLACKLQYPDMGAAVDADLAQLKIAFAIYRRVDRAI
ncbi:MAG: AarF/ABC1/UbiB kinase family protein, partial [Alphaproteobacteria bacterium]|nr:AarF/ABC1/UbiB kinase family protein [Alphaproteobacteria bacterium]